MTLETRETLHDLFPEAKDALHQLKLESAHFRTIAEKHESVSKEIYRIETDIEPASDERLEELKKERLALLDDIAKMISAHRH